MTSEGSIRPVETEDQSCTVADLRKVIEDIQAPSCKKACTQRPGMQPTVWSFSREFEALYPTNSWDEVYPRILLGDINLAQDKSKVKQLGVTHVVNCAQGSKFSQCDTSEEYYEDIDVHFFGISVMDNAQSRLDQYFSEAADFIDEALNDKGLVYVHCHQGISRSATIVMAFLMIKRRMTAIEALTQVRNKRAVHPNAGFQKQLCELNSTLYSSSHGSNNGYAAGV